MSESFIEVSHLPVPQRRALARAFRVGLDWLRMPDGSMRHFLVVRGEHTGWTLVQAIEAAVRDAAPTPKAGP